MILNALCFVALVIGLMSAFVGLVAALFSFNLKREADKEFDSMTDQILNLGLWAAKADKRIDELNTHVADILMGECIDLPEEIKPEIRAEREREAREQSERWMDGIDSILTYSADKAKKSKRNDVDAE